MAIQVRSGVVRGPAKHEHIAPIPGASSKRGLDYSPITGGGSVPGTQVNQNSRQGDMTGGQRNLLDSGTETPPADVV